MSSNLTVEEIVLINNLLYCEDLGGPKGTFLSVSHETKSIGDYINAVLRSSDEIDKNREYSTGVTGAEYLEILGAAKKNMHLRNIIIQEVHYESDGAGGGRSVFLYDPAYNEAIVAFKGTQSDAEWIDNVSGLYEVPTAFQKNALDWFRSLELKGYDTITVTGHSKGGNKAKFITIMEDCVDNCYSFDGQGFSDEFMQKYSFKIIKNRNKILNIIEESDFVNILLNDVGKKQFYLGTNFGRLGFAENHCANAILFFDEDGEMSLWKAGGQDKKMSDLDVMLNSFIRSVKMSTREKVANMLGNVIVNATGGNTDKIADTFSDERYSDSAAELIAYILRYKGEKPQMVASVREILSQNGFDTGMLGIIDFVTNHELLMELIGKNPKSMMAILKLKHVPDTVIKFLDKHIDLFDFIVLVSHKMRNVDPNKYSGKDIDFEHGDSFSFHAKGFFKRKRTWAAFGIGAAVIGAVVVAVKRFFF